MAFISLARKITARLASVRAWDRVWPLANRRLHDCSSTNLHGQQDVTQITVGIGGVKYYMYLDTSQQGLLYDPILYDPTVGVASNLATAFTGIPPPDDIIALTNPFPLVLKCLVTPIASPKLTQITQDTCNITMETTGDAGLLYIEQQRSGLPYALYFSQDPSVERFYIQPRLTNKPNPRKRIFQAVKKDTATADDHIFDFIPAVVHIIPAN